MRATVRPSHLARSAATTAEIGFDSALVANLNAAVLGRHLDHFARELVPQNSGIGVSRMLANDRAQIAAADSNLANVDQRLARRWSGARHLFFYELARRSKHDLAHTLFQRQAVRRILVQPLRLPPPIIGI